MIIDANVGGNYAGAFSFCSLIKGRELFDVLFPSDGLQCFKYQHLQRDDNDGPRSTMSFLHVCHLTQRFISSFLQYAQKN